MKKRYLSLFVLPICLTSCNQAIPLVFAPFSNYVDAQELRVDSDNEYFYQLKENKTISYINGTISSYRDLYNNYKNNRSRMNMVPTGERKLLVVPIYFSDSDKSTQDRKTILIQNAFFGEESHTNYESVASYFNKSSYGQLKLTGEVAPWYNAGISSSEWKNLSTSYMTASNILVAKAIDYLKENTLINLSDYDLDNDGYIDGIYAIYDHPLEKNNGSSIFWAYSYNVKENEWGYNTTKPYANQYSWSSIECIDQGNTASKMNISTTNYLLHETGHIFGLDDYYNTLYLPDETGVANDYHYQPTGCFDMMDYNVGDENPFSKYLLNWISPKVLKDNVNTTVELSSFTKTGECILVPTSKYNGTPYDEYLLIEYFTPDGLNDIDASFTYYDKNGERGVFNYINHHGLRIYHINASLGYFPKGGNSALICKIDDNDAANKLKGKNYCVDFAYSNTVTDAQAMNTPVLCHLLESSGENTFINGKAANNDTLFKYGDDFGITVFKDFTFDNGESLNYTFQVKKINLNKITIEIKSK